ncbi:MAG: DUF2142 domain-containing protein [Planctomycetota bacterium]|jgi:uncharacterized membrane protein
MIKFSTDSLKSVLDRLKPEAVFTVLALTGGLCMVFVNAPFEAPDEASHFWRAYHVYEGKLISSQQGNYVGGWIPKSVATAHLPFENLVNHPENRVDREVLSKSLQEPFEQEKCFMHLLFAGLYAPVVYVPQVIGIAAGRLLGASALGMMYAGRFVNLLCWIAVVYTAIRITPVFKWVFLLVALLPMGLYLAASLSADVSQNSISLLLLALVLRAFWQKESLHWKHMLAITLLCVFLAFSKQTYFPLTGLVLLIPADRFSGLRNKLLFCVTAIGLSLLVCLLWSMVIKGLYTPLHGANAPEQLSLLMGDPWGFFKILIDSIQEHWRGYAKTFIGVLGFLDTPLPNWIYFSYPFVLMGTALFDRGLGEPMDKKQRLWILAIGFGVFLLIQLSMYLTWTKPGEEIIEGVQGRYFLPVAGPILMALFYNRKFKSPAGSLGRLIIVVYSTTVLIATCLCLYDRYYGPV